MQSPPRAASQASSHFSLEPVPVSVLADKEGRRRDEAVELGLCRTGCSSLDDYVLAGGFERGSIVGISAEDEEMGVQLGLQTLAHSLCDERITTGLVVTPKPASVMLAGLRDAVKAELKERGVGEGQARARLRDSLERVMLSCVFDLDGLWEVLADLDRPEEEEEHREQEQELEPEQDGESEVEERVEEIQDSQDDDDEALSPPIRGPSPRQQQPPPPPPGRTATSHPEIIVITHFSSLLTSFFTHRERSAARSTLQLLGSHLRDLSRNLSSSPLILLLNSTSSPSSSGFSTSTTAAAAAGRGPPSAASPPAKHTPLDPTLRSIFNPPPPQPPPLGYSPYASSSRRTKPGFGLIFSQLLDLHLLCTWIPRTRRDAEAAVLRHEDGAAARLVGAAWVVEVLLDEMGVWEGRKGARPGREQRWTAVDVQGGKRVGNAVVEGVKGRPKVVDTGQVRVARGFGGPRV
ncbi:hypothetical protein ACJ41O_009548 [Fusarium nematophilum]